jgi:predicted SnoaL-like aldol condensation-catalyzing enzyme
LFTTTTIMIGAMIAVILPINQYPYHALAQNETLEATVVQQETSSVEENRALVESAIEEVFNQRNVSAADKYIAEDLINHNPLAGQGREPLKQYSGNEYFTAFPDSQTTIEQILGENDRVLVFLNWMGTHEGEFFGKQSTNKEVSMRTAHIFRIEDGMIAEQWEIADRLDS